MIFQRFRKLVAVGLAGWLWLGGAVLLAASEAATKPNGPAVLTITGKIARTNRPAFDERQDLFFKFHDRTFTKAYELDRAMLEALGTRKATVNYTGWPRPVTVEGPLLRDVLEAAGAQPGSVRITALDGFAVELKSEDLAGQEWVVAIKADGRDLAIGQRGPIWVLYARGDGKAATQEDEARWPWAAFLIEIE